MNPNLQDIINQYKTATPGAVNSAAPSNDWYSGVKSGAYRPQGISTQPTQESKSFGGFLGNAVDSSLNVAKGIGSAIVHPYDTVSNVAKLGAGALEKGVEKVTGNPIHSGDTAMLDNLIHTLGQRYGGKDIHEVGKNVANTAYKDPAGFLLDLSTVLGGAGGVASKLGKVGELSEVAKVGSALSKAGEVVNPIGQTLNVFGKGLAKATEGRQIGGGSYDPSVVGSAGNLGIPKENLPLSTMSNSNATNLAEGLAAKGLGGGKVMERIQGVYDSMNTKIDQLLSGKTPVADLGSNIANAVDDYKKDFYKGKNELYKEAVIPKTMKTIDTNIPGKETLAEGGMTRTTITADTQKTQSLLKDLIDKEKQALKGSGMAASPELKTYQGYLNGLSNKSLTASDVYQTLQRLEDDIKYGTAIKSGNNAKLALLQQTLDNEFSSSLKAQRPDLAAALDKADTFYQEGIGKLNSAYSQAIIKNADKPDIIVHSMLPKLESVEDIKSLRGIIGEHNMSGVRQQVLSDMFDNSKSAGNNNLSAGGISRQIKKFGDERLQAILQPEQYQAVKDLEKVSNAMSKGQKILSGSQSAFAAQIGLATGAVSAAVSMLATGNITGFFAALSPVLGNAALHAFVSSDIGRQILSEGLKLTGKTGKTLSDISPNITKGSQLLNVPKMADEAVEQP